MLYPLLLSTFTSHSGSSNVPDRRRKFSDILGGHREIGDEAVVVGPLSGVVADLDGEPVNRKGILGGAQRYRR
jgi:hypothetical protein